MTRRFVACLMLAAACARGSPDGTSVPADRPSDVRSSSFQDPRIGESSGVAVSRRWSGLIWTHNDSGDGPFVYVADTLGRGATRLTIPGAESVDWEDIALGPCPDGTCLYLADTGNNADWRSELSIYRVPEPASTSVGNALPGVATLRFRYPAGSEDVEAMFVAPDTSVHLISKTRGAPARHYRLPAAAWRATGLPIATDMGALSLTTDWEDEGLATGAALAPDGRRVAVRTYRTVHFFVLRADGTLEPDADWPQCDISGVDVQGEAIGWLGDTRLLLTSERGGAGTGRLSRLTCPHRGPVP